VLVKIESTTKKNLDMVYKKNATHDFQVISPFAASYLNGCHVPIQYNILLSYNIQHHRQITGIPKDLQN